MVGWSQGNERSFIMMSYTDGWMGGWMGGGVWIWTVIGVSELLTMKGKLRWREKTCVPKLN
jgi:hypothetical protein